MIEISYGTVIYLILSYLLFIVLIGWITAKYLKCKAKYLVLLKSIETATNVKDFIINKIKK